MIGRIVCYVPFAGITQMEMNSIIYFSAVFSDEIIKSTKGSYLHNPDQYTLTSVSNASNKSMLFTYVEFIDIIMKIFEHHSSS